MTVNKLDSLGNVLVLKTNLYEEEANYFATHLLEDCIPFHQDEIADLEIAEELEKYLDIKN